MKKLYILVIIVLLTGCTKPIYVDNQDEIENNSIVFIRNNLSTSLLVYEDDKYSLIELENKDKIYTISINVSIDNLILVDDVLTTIDYENKYILLDDIILDDLKIEMNDKILIELNDNKVCIYDKNISLKGNFSMCDFIYILNNEENVYISLNNNMKVLFYNEHINFSSKFLEHLYTTWIDTYIINNNELTLLEINKEDYIVKNIDDKI